MTKRYVKLRESEDVQLSNSFIVLSRESLYEYREDEDGENFRLVYNGHLYKEARTAFDFITVEIKDYAF